MLTPEESAQAIRQLIKHPLCSRCLRFHKVSTAFKVGYDDDGEPVSLCAHHASSGDD